jgi:hypothetical protein
LADRLELALEWVVSGDKIRQGVAELEQLPAENFQSGLNHLNVQLLAAKLFALLQQGSFLHQRVELQVSLLCFKFVSAAAKVLGDLLDLRAERTPSVSGRCFGWSHSSWQWQFWTANPRLLQG